MQESTQAIDIEDTDIGAFPAQNSVLLETADDARHRFPVRADPRGDIDKQRRR
jgi:hypothetical protein